MSDSAAARADYVRALTEERRGYEAAGNKERLADVDAELARFGAAPVKRTAPRKSTAAKKG